MRRKTRKKKKKKKKKKQRGGGIQIYKTKQENMYKGGRKSLQAIAHCSALDQNHYNKINYIIHRSKNNRKKFFNKNTPYRRAAAPRC
uniref:Uncharacterized protein n=1 Tax=Rhipicephalus zambeziensis TaxID=60191 RepID=A0A224YAW8_9ACAR